MGKNRRYSAAEPTGFLVPMTKPGGWTWKRQKPGACARYTCPASLAEPRRSRRPAQYGMPSTTYCTNWGCSEVEEIRVGFAVSGSFCTWSKAMEALEQTAQIYEPVTPIASEFAAGTDTRFGEAEAFLAGMEEICGRKVIRSIVAAEPIGPKKLLDVLVIAPCTGNTLAKLAAGIADSSVTMAAKAHLRNNRPVVVAVSTNDGLGAAARNIGELLCRKNYYFVPFRQDDPVAKPTSLVADMGLVPATIAAALKGEQLQPMLLGPEEA